jgi:hypothetical protein
MKRIALVISLAAVAAVWPAASGAATFNGVVVAKQHGSLLVASPSGLVRAFSGSAAVGSRVAVSGGRLAVVGRARFAHLRGIVVRHIGSTVFLSSNHHMLAVHMGRRLASANDNAPPPSSPTTTTTPTTPGAVVSMQTTIGANGELDEDQVEEVGQSSSAQIQAVVAAVGAGTVTLTVNGQSLVVPLPAGLTLPASVVGQTVTINLSFGAQGQSGDDDQNDQGDDSTTTSVSVGGDGGGGD